MKKNILNLLLFLSFFGYSQDYNLNIKGGFTTSGTDHNTCNTYFKIYLNNKELVYIDNRNDEGYTKSFDKNFTLTQSEVDGINHIYFYAKRSHYRYGNSNFSCLLRGEDEYSSTLNVEECVEYSYSNILNDDNTVYGTHATLTLTPNPKIPQPNPVEEIAQDESFNVIATAGFSSSLAYQWQYAIPSESTEDITSSRCQWGCYGGGGGTGGNIYGGTQAECDVYNSYSGCGSIYYPEIITPIYIWHDVTDGNLSTANILDGITPQDILPGYVGNIYFRMKYCDGLGFSDDGEDANFSMYTIVPASPDITALVESPRPCADSGSASITMTFSRELLPDERLYYTIYHNTGSCEGSPDFVDCPALISYYTDTLNSTNSLTIDTTSLNEGDYYIQTWTVVNVLGSGFAGYDPNDPAENFVLSSSKDDAFTITNPLPVTFTATPINVECFGTNSGKITIYASGGQGLDTYQYQLDGSLTWTDFLYSDSTIISGLSSGAYTIKVRDSNECVGAEQTVTIEGPDSAISLTENTLHQPSAYNGIDGYIIVDVIGGWEGYTIEWRNSDGDIISTIFDNTSQTTTVNEIGAGTYTLSVTDSGGCLHTATFILEQPPQLSLETIRETNAISCNFSCGTSNNGELTALNATGGVPLFVADTTTSPYEYTWEKETSPGVWTIFINNVLGANVASGLSAGNYRVNIKDANGITLTNAIEYTLNEPSPIIITNINSAVTNVQCFGEDNGSIQPNISGGTPFGIQSGGRPWYDILWSPTGETAKNIDSLEPGDYTVTITDANGCQITQTFTIQEPSEININIDSIISITSNGANNGAINVTVTGGVYDDSVRPIYTYEWKDEDGNIVSASKDISGLAPGFYTLTVYLGNCSKTTDSIEITEPLPLTVTTIANNVICYGDTGSINAIPNGGTPDPDYTYNWYQGTYESYTDLNIHTQNIEDLNPGSYFIEVIDFYNNTAQSEIVTITELDQLAFDEIIIEHNQCFGGEEGYVEFEVIGGNVGHYHYALRDANNELILQEYYASNLPAGDYVFTATDDGGCGELIYPFTINEPSELNLTLNEIVNTTGFGLNNGQISISISGGISPYSIEWINEESPDEIIGDSDTLEELFAGAYNVLITDNNGCTVTNTYVVTQPEELTVDVTYDPILCFGGETNLNAEVLGGTPFEEESVNYPYIIEWFDNLDILIGTGNTLNSKPAGEYKIKITDSNNNIKEINFTVEQLPEIIVTKTIVDVNCYNEFTGSIDIDVMGGSGDYTFLWNDVNNTTTEDIEDLSAGSYQVTITDTNGSDCSIISEEFIIIQPNAELTVNETVTQITGNGLHNGVIDIQVEGGTAPYTYNWIGSNGFASTQSTIDNLEVGFYTLIVTDDLDCSITIENIEINEPEPLVVSIEETLFNSCNGDNNAQLSANVEGGIAPYTYTWSNTEDPSLIFPADASISNLPSGTYQVVIEDSNNNIANAEFTITNILEIQVNALITNVNCYGGNTGAIDISVTGGTVVGNYTYVWSNGETSEDLLGLSSGTYNLRVTDDNLCYKDFSYEITQPLAALFISSADIIEPTGYNLSNGSITITVEEGTAPYTYQWYDSTNTLLSSQTSNILSNVGADTYDVIVTDAKGCMINATYLLVQPPLLEVEINYEEISCHGDQTTVIASASGGVLNNGDSYQYQWFDSTNTLVSSSQMIDLFAGTYHLVIIDSNNNIVEQDIILVEPTQIEIIATNIVDVICYDEPTGSITINVTGGIEDYIFQWNNGIQTQNLENVLAGIYNVTITDENGCFIISEDFEIQQPPNFYIQNANLTQPSGAGLSDGSIDITISGGQPPFIYEWTNENGTVISNTEDINNIATGSYTINITDANCEIQPITYLLDEPSPLEVSIEEELSIQCFGDSSASLNANVTGGVGGNTYQWYEAPNTLIYTSSSTSLISNISVGEYYVVVADANGIIVTSEHYIVEEPEQIIVSSQTIDNTCFEDNDGSITLEASGGNESFLYRIKSITGTYGLWIPFDNITTTIITSLAADDYKVQVKDTNDCYFELNDAIATLEFNITQPDLLTIEATVNNVTGYNLENGSITIEVQGGTPTYQFEWQDSDGTVISTEQDINELSPGSYTLNVLDANNCSSSANYTITQPDLLIVSVDIQNELLCFGNESGSVIAEVSGGEPFITGTPYLYHWYITGTTAEIGTEEILANLSAESYYVVIEDANGNLVTSDDFILESPDELSVTFTANYTNCGAENDWVIEANVQGGIPPYTYNWNTGDNTDTITEQSLGNYMLVVSDDNGCQISETYSIEEPEFLNVEVEVTDLTCFDTCDGEINLSISGGTAPYDIVWNDESTEINRTNLCDGIYEVTVTDQNGCVFEYNHEFINPNEIIIGLENQVTTLCIDQSLDLDITIDDEDAVYNWQCDNGFSSSSPVVSLTEEGLYLVTVTTNGCEIYDSVEIISSEIGLNAQFLITSQAFAGEDVIIINTSNPISSDMEWIIPSNVQIIEENIETITVRFNTEGLFELSLRSTVGDCQDDYTKSIIVNEARDLPEVGNTNEPFISNFIIYPNPTNGVFSVNVELMEPANISLRLYSLISQSPLDDRIETGLNDYNLDYSLSSLSSGTYFLLLETPHGKQIRKIIIE